MQAEQKDEKSIIPSECIVSILGSGTYITGKFKVTGSISLPADKLYVYSNEKLAIPVTTTLPLTTVTTSKGLLVGRLRSVDRDIVTIVLQDGVVYSTKYKDMSTQPFATHVFSTDHEQDIQLKILYKDGVSYKVISRVVSSSTDSYVIQQSVDLSNQLPFDLNDLQDLLISFQGNTHKTSSRTLPASAMYEMKSQSLSAPVDELMENVSKPINHFPLESAGLVVISPVGKISKLPAFTCINLVLPKPVTLKVLRDFIDIEIQSYMCTSTLELSPLDGTLYPANITVDDQITGAPKAHIKVPLQVVGGSFETSLGTVTTVTVKSWKVDQDPLDVKDQKYTVGLKSNSTRTENIRISGWILKGRTDVYQLVPGATSTFTGLIPKERVQVKLS